MKIEFLKIFTPRVQDQKEFYQKVLGFPVEQSGSDSIQVRIGYSILEIQEREGATPYHIAFHIPAKQEEIALEWLKQRVPILKSGEHEIVDFSSWNAKSLYFYDTDKNVVEFISRRHCFPSNSNNFTGRSPIGISEIGVAISNVKSAYDFLNSEFSLEKFTGDYQKFCATGNDEGLFIVIDKNQKDWFPSDDKAFPSDFEIRFSTGDHLGELEYKNGELKRIKRKQE